MTLTLREDQKRNRKQCQGLAENAEHGTETLQSNAGSSKSISIKMHRHRFLLLMFTQYNGQKPLKVE